MYGTLLTLGKRFLSATESRPLAFGYMPYGRATLATSGFLVFVRLLKNIDAVFLFGFEVFLNKSVCTVAYLGSVSYTHLTLPTNREV